MAERIHIKKSTKGSYTLEAALFLPFVILAVLSLGYLMKVIGTWENCIHGAVDESMLIASRSYDSINGTSIGAVVSKRINDDNPQLASMRLKDIKIMYNDGHSDDVTSYRITAAMELKLPMGFSRRFTLDQKIKFRGFTGVDEPLDPMGSNGLETYEEQYPVWIFPHSGEKYHDEDCTYVKAAASPSVLKSSLKKKYETCGLCGSGNIPTGSIVFCFKSEDTAYHRGTCSAVTRHTAIIDRVDAEQKGYVPCSKCGGG